MGSWVLAQLHATTLAMVDLTRNLRGLGIQHSQTHDRDDRAMRLRPVVVGDEAAKE